MKLFELNRLTYEIDIAPEALLLEPFKRLIDRDKSKTKDMAKKELALIYHYCDIRSDYSGMENNAKLAQIIENLKFSKGYTPDKLVKEAMEFYMSFKTPIQELYEGAVIAAQAVNEYLRKSKELLEERTEDGKIVTDIAKITASIEKLPKIMMNLKTAEKEYIKETKETEGRMKGSKELGMFEGTNTFKID